MDIMKASPVGELATIEDAKMAKKTLDDAHAISSAYKLAASKAIKDGDMQQAKSLMQASGEIDVQCGYLKLAIGDWLNSVPKGNKWNTVNSASDGIDKQSARSEIGISSQTASQYQRMAANRETVERILNDPDADKGNNALIKAIKADKTEQMRRDKAKRKDYETPASIPDTCKLFVGDIYTGLPQIADNSIDAIITDPPYPREYLGCWSHLAEVAGRVLKPGGSLIAMSGQSYLPEVIENMQDSGLTYHWTACYLTPGGQSPSLWAKRVNTFWKPLLWFTKGKYEGDYVGDVIKTDANANDKMHHHWGQGVGGFSEIIERFTYPGDVVLDPFLGGGTTGLCAVMMGRHFIGCDIDEECVSRSKDRIESEVAHVCH